MQAYLVSQFLDYLPGNTRTFFISKQTLDGDNKEIDDVLLLRDFDYKFAHFRGETYRVCIAEFDDDGDDPPFIRVWLNDPFRGFEDYEQITDQGFPSPDPPGFDYSI